MKWPSEMIYNNCEITQIGVVKDGVRDGLSGDMLASNQHNLV